ncbi:MAG: enolase C-terminal domain-like protein, partial [Gemmataceae bacterium]
LFNGLTHLKIKLNGDDLEWDLNRVLGVENATKEAQAKRGITEWKYSLDFNEKCRNVRYLLDFIEELRSRSPSAFSRISYIEQPTARDLSANRANVMHDASRQIPVVIDESLVDLDSLFLAREMGYTGVALKACKGQSQSVLFASAARHLGMFLCVQDLTCPGASLIQSASLAAHVKGVQAIESNGRQYCPAANKAWETDFPGLFLIKGGMAITGNLNGPGLGAYKR